MALIYCPECGKQVSDKATSCPHCAYPLNNERSAPSQRTQEKPQVIVKSKEGCFLQTLNAGCMVIVVIIGLILLVIFMS